jgi:hypothetical protein
MQPPIVYGYSEHVVDGGLISYGVDLRECFHRSAVYMVLFDPRLLLDSR